MSNLGQIKNKTFEIEIGGQKRELKFDLNAFADLEEHYDSIEDLFKRLEKGQMSALRAFLWAGLQHESRPAPGKVPKQKLSLEDVGALVDFESMTKMFNQMQNAIKDSLPEAEANQGNA